MVNAPCVEIELGMRRDILATRSARLWNSPPSAIMQARCQQLLRWRLMNGSCLAWRGLSSPGVPVPQQSARIPSPTCGSRSSGQAQAGNPGLTMAMLPAALCPAQAPQSLVGLSGWTPALPTSLTASSDHQGVVTVTTMALLGAAGLCMPEDQCLACVWVACSSWVVLKWAVPCQLLPDNSLPSFGVHSQNKENIES